MMNETPESRYIAVNNLRLHYLEWGHENVRPVLLLHGIGDNAHVWHHCARTLQEEFRVIALDQRGHGRSDWAVPPAYTCDDYVSDLESIVRALDLKRFVLMGHSMGALHATEYTARHTDKVAGLIHADIEPYPPDWNKKYLSNLYENLPFLYDTVDEYVSHMQKNSPYAQRGLLCYIACHALDQEGNGRLRCQYDREVLSHFDQYDVRSSLSSIPCPVLIIRGEESRVMRRSVAMEMCDMLSRGQFAEICDAAHPVHTDNPGEFQRVVRDFLREINFMTA